MAGTPAPPARPPAPEPDAPVPPGPPAATVADAAPPESRPIPLVDATALTGTALSLRGIPYRNGGADPGGFDCSGFTQYVFAHYGITLPRDVKAQFGAGRSVDRDEIAPGDLLFFTTVAPGASHVGIALDSRTFVHAPSSSGVVRVEDAGASYWSRRFVGARRVS